MDSTPQPVSVNARNAIARIADFIGVPVSPAPFPAHILRFRNDRAAATVGLDSLDDAQWIAHFGRFSPLPGSLPEPLALRYHGHQFRMYNPDIGDGRGFLFAQVQETADSGGRLLDLGTKGSGQTPYSRFGDGRLTLKGGVREILATEMLEALGVTTSRTFSLIETGEALDRNDEPSPTRSAVLVRLSHGHIRIGSFQRLAALSLHDETDRLVSYCLDHLYGLDGGDNPALTLFRAAVDRCADLAASYMVAGFVHGVLNSDNIAITGESFDYGPWRFAPRWDEDFTAAYFDHTGLYAFGRQAEAIHWDLAQLAGALAGRIAEKELVDAFSGFSGPFRRRFDARFLWRLGVTADDNATASAVADAAVQALRETGQSIDDFFFDWRCARDRAPDAYANASWQPFRDQIARCTPLPGGLDHPYWSAPAPCSMLIDEVEAIWAAIADRDDWSVLTDKVNAIRAMGDALAPRPPRPGP